MGPSGFAGCRRGGSGGGLRVFAPWIQFRWPGDGLHGTHYGGAGLFGGAGADGEYRGARVMQGVREVLRGSLGRSLRALPEEDRLAAAWVVACGPALAERAEVLGL